MDDSLTVLFNNSETEEYQGYHFESLLYGVMDENPDAEVFYDVNPSSEARKAEVEAYMTEAFEEGTIYGHLAEYGGEPLVRTAKVLSDPDISVDSFDAGPVRLETGEQEREEYGQEIPDDISSDLIQGRSMHQRGSSDESFAEYIVDNASRLEDTVVLREAPTALVSRLEDLDVRVHRANDQPLSQKELKRVSSFGAEYQGNRASWE
jgi:hypothetical protein